MAKGKKKSVASGGPHKKHGPKRKMHHCWTSTIRLALAKAGLLSKYNNFESWQQACQAKGKRNTTKADFNEFIKLSQEQKVEYFKDIK